MTETDICPCVCGCFCSPYFLHWGLMVWKKLHAMSWQTSMPLYTCNQITVQSEFGDFTVHMSCIACPTVNNYYTFVQYKYYVPRKPIHCIFFLVVWIEIIINEWSNNTGFWDSSPWRVLDKLTELSVTE